MKINFSYFRQQGLSGVYQNATVFVITKAEQLNKTPYQVLSEMAALVKKEDFSIDASLLVVSDGGKKKYYGDNLLVDIVSSVGLPRFTHTLSV